MLEKTIAAIATALGPAGIGIIRISGHEALEIIYKIFIPKSKELKKFNFISFKNSIESHKVYFGRIINHETNEILDEAIIFYMKSPKSYTREDVIEIQVHSGIINLERILKVVINAGASFAEAGEFTKRAFENGRIDLTQAESIIDLINAPCEKAAQIAVGQISGLISKKIEKLKNNVYGIQAKIEACIEFNEENYYGSEQARNEARENLINEILPEIKAILKNSEEQSIYTRGITITIAGYPNVGKSSLLNCLSKKQTAIVSQFPGTTRDVVKDFLNIKGIPILICDTAGIRKSTDPIEIEGIKRTKECINYSDIIIFLLDGSRDLNKVEREFILEKKNKIIITAINKIDISTIEKIEKIEKNTKEENIYKISAKNGVGIEELKESIFEAIKNKTENKIDVEIANLRQCQILQKIEKEINAIVNDQMSIDLHILSTSIGIIIEKFNEITGTKNSIELYNQIFKQFCIGK